MKKAVYTFIFGEYDTLKEPKVITPGWDYLCFTDAHAPHNVGVWKMRPPIFPGRDSKKWAVQHMILAYKAKELREYDVTVSIGGQIQVNCDLDQFVEKRFRPHTDLMLVRHHERACVYDEAAVVSRMRRDDPVRIEAQMARYRKEGLPPSLGLFMSGIVGRRKGNPALEQMCEAWWQEVEKGTRRDQLALPYALHFNGGFKISEIGYWQTYRAERSFLLFPHADQ